jgi:hypothetical protein
MSGRHKEASPRRGRLLGATLALALVVAGGYVAYDEVAGPDDASATGCDQPSVGIAVTPEMGPTLDRAAEALAGAGARCVVLDVTEATSAEVAGGVLGDDLPELWIPDSATWLRRTAAAVPKPAVLEGSLASSPVVLAVREAAPAPSSWLAALSSGTVAVVDPLRSSAGTAALLSVQAERELTGATQEQIGGVLVPAAQSYGAQPEPIRDADAAYAALTAPGSQVVAPVSEQSFLAFARANPGTSAHAAAPKTGAVLLDYPLATFDGEDADATQAGEALTRYLASADGKDLLRAASFRDPDGAGLGDGVGVGDVPVLQVPREAAVVKSTLRTWSVLTVPSRILAVFDVSGSMDFAAGDSTRMALTVEAAATGLQMFPGSAQIGAWAFSDGSLTAGGVPYRKLLAIKGLDQQSGGATHRDRLRATLQSLPRLTGGGTALDDSLLAAYREAQRTYDPDAVNTVLLLTDGSEDGSSTVSEGETVATLRREYNPAKPVQVIFIGISEDADVAALQRLSRAAHGRYYVAREPGDIATVFIDSFLSR